MPDSSLDAPPGLRIDRADLSHARDRRDYREQLARYAADPMGGSLRLDDVRLNRVCDDLARLPHALAFLARLDRQTVGFATCFTGYSTFRARPLMNIHDLAVLAEFRGRGIGRALLAHIAGEAQATGCCKLTLEVREDNPLAAGFYGRFGFTSARTATGLSIQYLFMEKRLDTG